MITHLADFMKNNPTIEMLYDVECNDAFVISEEKMCIPITSIVQQISAPRMLFMNRNTRLIQLNEQVNNLSTSSSIIFNHLKIAYHAFTMHFVI